MNGQQQVAAAAAHIAAAASVVAFTGAGVSAESGIPTFRDTLTGLWAQYDPAALATPRAFNANPKLVWDFYEMRRQIVAQSLPNAGHVALAGLEARLGDRFALITQNVDDLHERAGSRRITRLHGRLDADKCGRDCRGMVRRSCPCSASPRARGEPPRCPWCAAFLRPDVVWFEEMLPLGALERARALAAAAQVILVIGTSGAVYPAAELPYLTKRRGGVIVEINPTRSALTDDADIWIAAPSGAVLPLLLAALGSGDA